VVIAENPNVIVLKAREEGRSMIIASPLQINANSLRGYVDAITLIFLDQELLPNINVKLCFL
jgi:hypothetical protein